MKETRQPKPPVKTGAGARLPLIDQAVDEHRNPQQWWGEVLRDTTGQAIDEQKGS
ncbi:MAG: hypothetical protein O3C40_26590 [Planctomycetota bacterium]|nr:hypothetical protein [Planctomycetota bacterium]